MSKVDRAPRRRQRRLVRAVLLLGALLVAGVLPMAATPQRAAGVAGAATGTPPDVVVILTDDQRDDSLRRMPTVWNELVRKGVRLTNAYVPTSLCCPSRATILTGLFAHSTRVFHNAAPEGGWQRFEAEGLEQRTIAAALDSAGYRTGLVGKYLNGFDERAAAGQTPPGWDSFVTFTSGMGYYDYTLNDGRTYGHDPEDYSTDVLADHAESFVRSTPAGTPLFLYFAPWAPHRPFTPAPRHEGHWAGRIPSYDGGWVREDLSDNPPWMQGRTARKQSRIDADLSQIQDSLMAVDEATDQLVDALRDSGRLDNTLLIFLSDNGSSVGEHHLRVWKGLPYRFTTDIPMVMRWDGRVDPGTTDSRTALNVDVAETIASAAGVEMSSEGLDLLGAERRRGFPLEGGPWVQGDSPPRRPAYCGYRTHRWMFTRYAEGTEELFDYRRDPYELRNLADRSRFADKLQEFRGKARKSCTPTPPGFSW